MLADTAVGPMGITVDTLRLAIHMPAFEQAEETTKKRPRYWHLMEQQFIAHLIAPFVLIGIGMSKRQTPGFA